MDHTMPAVLIDNPTTTRSRENGNHEPPWPLASCIMTMLGRYVMAEPPKRYGQGRRVPILRSISRDAAMSSPTHGAWAWHGRGGVVLMKLHASTPRCLCLAMPLPIARRVKSIHQSIKSSINTHHHQHRHIT